MFAVIFALPPPPRSHGYHHERAAHFRKVRGFRVLMFWHHHRAPIIAVPVADAILARRLAVGWRLGRKLQMAELAVTLVVPSVGGSCELRRK